MLLRTALKWHILHYFTCIDIVELYRFCNFSTLQDLQCTWPEVWLYCDHTLYQTFQITRVNAWRVIKDSFYDSFVQFIHICCSEGWMQGQCLIKYTTQTPYVALAIVWLIVPDLGTSIVRRSSLSIQKASFGHLWNIHVAKSCASVIFQEQVGRLDITMKHS